MRAHVTVAMFGDLTEILHPSQVAVDNPQESTVAAMDRMFLAATRAARAAYLDRAGLKIRAAALGYESAALLDPLERGDAQAAILHAPGLTVIAPRGSSSAGDWRADLRSVWRRRYWHLPVGKMGAGFADHADELENGILLAGYAAQERRDLIVVVGHSLGGALVAPVLLTYKRAGIEVAQAITLEAPRPLNSAAAEWWIEHVDVPTWRVVHIRERSHTVDLVTRVPPSALGARHIGYPVMLMGRRTFFGREAWQDHRAKHPVSWWWKLRPVTRLAHAVGVHFGDDLEKTLVDRIEARILKEVAYVPAGT